MRSCLVCGFRERLIRHHVAGRRNDAALVVDLCGPHAAWADRALVVLGVRLGSGERHPAEIAFAQAAGALALLVLVVGPNEQASRAFRDAARRTGRKLRRYVGPLPSETGPLVFPPPTGLIRTELLALMGSGRGSDPVEAFEDYCRRQTGALR